VCGDLSEHRELEAQLAAHVDLPDAVLFPSGFQLNVGVLPAILGPGDVVYSDALNHASLIDGLRLSAARRIVLPHRNAPPAPPAGTALHWWVSEAIFSMDGDRIDLPAAQAYLQTGGALYLDEAHSFGLFDGGRPLSTVTGLRPTLLVCTLGKALGCAGAFVAGSARACEWVRTQARSFVFSTGLAPPIVARVRQALSLLVSDEGDERRVRLWRNAALLARLLEDGEPPAPIFPIVVGDNQTALDISRELVAEGWHAQPIRPPTVPAGTARLRVTVSAGHTPAQLEAFAAALHSAFARRGLRPTVQRGQSSPTRPRVVGADT
jgi:7-keto-8-aminopelargonate synthetase-like enzyme